jgi:hypothetical protein
MFSAIKSGMGIETSPGPARAAAGDACTTLPNPAAAAPSPNVFKKSRREIFIMFSLLEYKSTAGFQCIVEESQ